MDIFDALGIECPVISPVTKSQGQYAAVYLIAGIFAVFVCCAMFVSGSSPSHGFESGTHYKTTLTYGPFTHTYHGAAAVPYNLSAVMKVQIAAAFLLSFGILRCSCRTINGNGRDGA